MAYSANTCPRSAPNQREPNPMPRPSPAQPSRPAPRTLARLRALDISCACKCSLIVSCAVADAEPGCRERRACGTCPCQPRRLPACILEPGTPHGCARWREGKSCQCPEMWMPRCLVTGCAERRRGRKCECPRTPTELCPHILNVIRRWDGLTPQEAARLADVWAEQLWTLLPQQYADRPLAAEGCTVRTREAAVALMTVRQALGLSLWSDEDEIGLPDDAVRLRRQAAGLRRLLGIGAAPGKAGAA